MTAAKQGTPLLIKVMADWERENGCLAAITEPEIKALRLVYLTYPK